EGLIRPLAGTVRRLYDDAWRRVLEGSPLFGPFVEATFPHEQRLDEQGLVDRVVSMSYVAASPDETRAEVERRLRELPRDRGGEVVIPYTTSVHVMRRREPARG